MTTHRNIVYRLLPERRSKAVRLARLAGACRYVWNAALAHNRDAYQAYERGEGERPSTSFFSLCQWFVALRRETPWLQSLPMAEVRHVLKYQSEAFARFFKDGGHPRFKAKHGKESVTIPQNVNIENGRLWIPKTGWYTLRRKGGNPYPDGQPVKAVITRTGGKWYCAVVYDVDLPERPDDGTAIGVDMNAGQVADSTGRIHRGPDMERLEARRKRYQRKIARQVKGSNRRRVTKARLAKTARRIANARKNWQHHVSKDIAGKAAAVVVEKLNTRGMTASGGTRKRGLNRVILATGWHALRHMLAYKAAAGIVEVDPAYTSQTCRICGYVDAENRKTQATFRCVRCGHAENADVHAAINVLTVGTAVSGRRGALVHECYPADPSIVSVGQPP